MRAYRLKNKYTKKAKALSGLEAIRLRLIRHATRNISGGIKLSQEVSTVNQFSRGLMPDKRHQLKAQAEGSKTEIHLEGSLRNTRELKLWTKKVRNTNRSKEGSMTTKKKIGGLINESPPSSIGRNNAAEIIRVGMRESDMRSIWLYGIKLKMEQKRRKRE